jgi:hypothetical protein
MNGTASSGDRAGNSAGSPGGERGARNGVGARTLDGTIADAVKLGYQIIEEQIEQGKKVASQLSASSYSANSLGGDTADFLGRLLRFYSDIGSTCFEFIETLSRSVPGVSAARSRPGNTMQQSSASFDGMARPERPAKNADGAADVAMEIASAVPVRVALNVAQTAMHRRLGVHGLFALNSSIPPLQDVEFRREGFADAPTLVVRIPDGQPAGTYTGAVIDFENNEALGTVTVHICNQ